MLLKTSRKRKRAVARGRKFKKQLEIVFADMAVKYDLLPSFKGAAAARKATFVGANCGQLPV